jgi:ABC-type spermidine/putrescine transport system permease subunit II
VARWLLAPLAVTSLLAGLLPLLLAVTAGWHGVWTGLHDPALAPTLHAAAMAALLATAIAVPLGVAGALATAASPPAARGLVYALAVLLLLTPAPGFAGLDFLSPPDPAGALAFACAVARGAALALLILAPNLHAQPPGLRRAAGHAGATPWQAWRDAVLVPLAWPLVGAAGAALSVAWVEGPASTVLAPHFDQARAWVAPAALLLVAGSVAALAVLLRPRAT